MKTLLHALASLLFVFLAACGTLEVALDKTPAPSSDLSAQDTPQPATGQGAAPQLTVDSTSDEIQQAMLTSATKWKTIWLDGAVTWYAPDGTASKQVYHEQTWIDQMTSRFRILLSAANSDAPETFKACDGATILEMNVKSGQSQSSPLPDFAHAGQYVPTMEAGVAYPNPLWGQIGTPLSEMVFSSNYAQNQGTFKPVNTEVIAGRRTLAIEWTYAGNSQLSFRAWLDVETAIMLKLQEFGKSGGDTLTGERVVNQVVYDAAFDSSLFGIPSVTPQFGDIAGTATNAAVTEATFPSAQDALGNLYFFTLPHQAGQNPQLVRLPGSCVVGWATCPQLETIAAPFPFSFSLSALAWSPDGKLAAFAYPDNANGTPYKLWLFDPALKSWRSLAEFPYMDPPYWSPDGAWLAFREQDGKGGEDVYVIHRDGTGLKNLTASGDLPVNGRPYVIDGWLAENIIIRSGLPGKAGSVYLIRASDGTIRPMSETLLTRSVLFPSQGGSFLAYDNYDDGSQKHVLQVLEPDGANPVTLASFAGGSLYPIVWSPDESRIAFAYFANYVSGNPSASVYVVGRDGRGLTQVYQGVTVGSIHFSPDGKFLLVEETTSPTGGHLFIVNLETLEQRILQAPGLSLDTDWYAPSWDSQASP